MAGFGNLLAPSTATSAGRAQPAAQQMAQDPMARINQYVLQNIQALLAANPSFLTSGIPNKLLSQMWMQAPMKVIYKKIRKLVPQI